MRRIADLRLLSTQTSRDRFVALPAGAAIKWHPAATDTGQRKSNPQRERQFDADFTQLRWQFKFLQQLARVDRRRPSQWVLYLDPVVVDGRHGRRPGRRASPRERRQWFRRCDPTDTRASFDHGAGSFGIIHGFEHCSAASLIERTREASTSPR